MVVSQFSKNSNIWELMSQAIRENPHIRPVTAISYFISGIDQFGEITHRVAKSKEWLSGGSKIEEVFS